MDLTFILMVSSLYTCHENHNLQVATYLNPKTHLVGADFQFSHFTNTKNELQKIFFIIIFSPWVVFF